MRGFLNSRRATAAVNDGSGRFARRASQWSPTAVEGGQQPGPGQQQRKSRCRATSTAFRRRWPRRADADPERALARVRSALCATSYQRNAEGVCPASHGEALVASRRAGGRAAPAERRLGAALQEGAVVSQTGAQLRWRVHVRSDRRSRDGRIIAGGRGAACGRPLAHGRRASRGVVAACAGVRRHGRQERGSWIVVGAVSESEGKSTLARRSRNTGRI